MNWIKDKMETRPWVSGIWLASGSPVAAELASGAGFDWALLNNEVDVVQSVSGLLGGGVTETLASGIDDTVRFGVVSGDTSFFGFIDALRERRARIMTRLDAIVPVARVRIHLAAVTPPPIANSPPIAPP